MALLYIHVRTSSILHLYLHQTAPPRATIYKVVGQQRWAYGFITNPVIRSPDGPTIIYSKVFIDLSDCWISEYVKIAPEGPTELLIMVKISGHQMANGQMSLCHSVASSDIPV